jgi:predicted polyphosphate/ATP-dependent NAD kinase
VNPIAGMGGKVGLKGTDGIAILKQAMKLGAEPVSSKRAMMALERLIPVKDEIEIITYPSAMGEDACQSCGIEPIVIGSLQDQQTTSEDTKKAARQMVEMQVELILFAGGDGTARDISDAVDLKVPVLGIPTGVKMHSGVFALNPHRAGDLILQFLRGEARIEEAEVMDIDEEAFRGNRLSAKLYGYLKIPTKGISIQPSKSASVAIRDELSNQEAIAEQIIAKMDDSTCYILGPGTTVRAISNLLNLKKTLLGVDAVYKGNLIAEDLNEQGILKIVEQYDVRIIVSPIGGQGFIFGRGNQQISSEVIRRVGIENIMVIATVNKLTSIGVGRPLLIDTGDPEFDDSLSGYIRVVTGHNEEVMLKLSSGR